MQSVGESRQRVTFAGLCPHFHAQLHADLLLAVASRRVTLHQNCLFAPPFSYGVDRHAAAHVRQPDNPAIRAHAAHGINGAAGPAGMSRNTFSGRRQPYQRDDTSSGKWCIFSTRNSWHLAFMPYRRMHFENAALIKCILINYGTIQWVTFAEHKVGTFCRAPKRQAPSQGSLFRPILQGHIWLQCSDG
jgi:hypothetical protein